MQMVQHTAVSTSCNTKLHKKIHEEKGRRVIESQCLQIYSEKMLAVCMGPLEKHCSESRVI